MGTLLPTHMETMSLDQIQILILGAGEFGDTTKATPSEAIKMGVDRDKIKPLSRAAMLRQQADERAKAANGGKKRRDKRRRAR
jgi:hypothetical protein